MKQIILWGLLVVAILLEGCTGCDTKNTATTSDSTTDNVATTGSDMPAVQVPPFNADSAYQYVAQQCNFGPRTVGSTGHAQCLAYLVKHFKAHGATVQVQEGRMKHPKAGTVPIKNIIASYQPAASVRILLSAHWDTRPMADEDTNKAHHNKPILGANDGASGVGVLMEIARQLNSQPLSSVGVDIILWDAEDMGVSGSDESWCLGSQYWANNKHVNTYAARYGINLDMVGAKGATFVQEMHTVQFAAPVANRIWQTAHRLGFGGYFPTIQQGVVLDDHYFINKIAGIPCANIIHLNLDPSLQKTFFKHWHTMGDDMDKIDPQTLKAVGQTVLDVVYRETTKPAA
jgi:Zn-dependent M28 family amino/carboxypeptidase